MIGLLLRARDNHHVDVYTVHERPDHSADRLDRAEELIFVKDGFTWGAAMMPPVYFMSAGEWAALGAYLGAVTVLYSLLSTFGVSADWIMAAILALHVFIGFEASSLQRALLNWRGWSEIGSVSGRNLAECERRFFETWLPSQPAVSALRESRDPAGTLAGAAVSLLDRSGLGQNRNWRRVFGSDN
jgi:hypothetical protein